MFSFNDIVAMISLICYG